MKICYVDESGCTGMLPSPTSDVQPVMVFTGLIIDASHLTRLTASYLSIQRRFFPNVVPQTANFLDRILHEVKGSTIRRQAAHDRRRVYRHALGYMDKLVSELQAVEAKLIGRIWIKGIDRAIDGRALYTSSIQRIYEYFQAYLSNVDDIGMIVADGRLKQLNSQVAHSIFTQKFKRGGDEFPKVVELPAFAHSDNHVGLQLSDFLASALVTPVAIHRYCLGYIDNVHIRPGYERIAERYIPSLQSMQFRYQSSDGKWRGGLVVRDDLAQRSGRSLFIRQSGNASEPLPTIGAPIPL